MDTKQYANLLLLNEATFNELYVIETIVKMTKKSCEDFEFNGKYYDMPAEKAVELSAERNNYINMFNLIIERVANLMKLNISIENSLCYSKTPTMAAER